MAWPCRRPAARPVPPVTFTGRSGSPSARPYGVGTCRRTLPRSPRLPGSKRGHRAVHDRGGSEPAGGGGQTPQQCPVDRRPGAGLRQGEALGLHWEDVDLDAGHVRIRKNRLRPAYAHGCGDSPCGRKPGCCPLRRQIRREHKSTKSRAGRRTVGLPDPLIKLRRQHQEEQARDALRLAPIGRTRDTPMRCGSRREPNETETETGNAKRAGPRLWSGPLRWRRIRDSNS